MRWRRVRLLQRSGPVGQLACPQREGRDYKGFVQEKGERSRAATWSVWSRALFCVLQLTIWKKGLLKCRKKRSGTFLIGTSTLPEAYLPGFSSAGVGQARRGCRAGRFSGRKMGRTWTTGGHRNWGDVGWGVLGPSGFVWTLLFSLNALYSLTHCYSF